MNKKIPAMLTLSLVLAGIAFGQTGTVRKGTAPSPFDPDAVFEYCTDIRFTITPPAPGPRVVTMSITNTCSAAAGHGLLDFFAFADHELTDQGSIDLSTAGPFDILFPLPATAGPDTVLRVLFYGEYHAPFGPTTLLIPIFTLKEYTLMGPGGAFP